MTRMYVFGGAAVLFIAIVFGAILFLVRSPHMEEGGSLLTFDQARLVATVSECSEKGGISADGQYATATQTWVFGIQPNAAFQKEGCHPTCIVSEGEKSASIDWGCAEGVTPPTGEVTTSTPPSTTSTMPVASKDDLLRVSMPVQNQTVESPLRVQGEARGSWYFEASFPVHVYDARGKLLGSAVAQAQGDWMTTSYVPFTATIQFVTSTTPTGTLVLEKDNPSGLPEQADELRIPVRFSHVSAVQQVKLFYYNPTKDVDVDGNVLCSSKGLVAVTRTIPVTQTPVQDTVRLLLRGELTSAERDMGITTEFPLSGFSLKGAAVKEGALTLELVDSQNKTSGGSCRASVLWNQIEATAKQFSGVTSVRFTPETLFQP